jgi:hypothetical protein
VKEEKCYIVGRSQPVARRGLEGEVADHSEKQKLEPTDKQERR